MRRVFVSAVIATAVLPVASIANPAPNYATAYSYAVRCFVISGANRDQAGARPAFDAAIRLGRLQGFSNARINVDFDWAISRETQNMQRDTGYKERTLAQCRKLGWAS